MFIKAKQKSGMLLIAALALCVVAILTVFLPNKRIEASAWWTTITAPIDKTTHNRDIDGTHQTLARAAYAYVYPMFTNTYSIFPAPNNNGGTTITRYADWPDNNNEEGSDEWSGYHMYYVPNPGPINAKTRFIYHYEKAVELYLNNEKEPNSNNIGAWGHLGAAIHYLCDLATPVHTGDPKGAGNVGNYNFINHHNFEGYADQIVDSTTVNTFCLSRSQFNVSLANLPNPIFIIG